MLLFARDNNHRADRTCKTGFRRAQTRWALPGIHARQEGQRRSLLKNHQQPGRRLGSASERLDFRIVREFRETSSHTTYLGSAAFSWLFLESLPQPYE